MAHKIIYSNDLSKTSVFMNESLNHSLERFVKNYECVAKHYFRYYFCWRRKQKSENGRLL